MKPIAIELVLLALIVAFAGGFLVGYHRGFYTGTAYKSNVINTGYQATLPAVTPTQTPSWWRTITYTTTPGPSTALLRVCPDGMIDNQMPSPEPRNDRQYYIMNGQRYEVNQFDAQWVSANCQVSVQTVY